MRSAFISIALVLACIGRTVAIVPELVKITENTSSGNGCPPGSVVTTTTAEGDLVTLDDKGTKTDWVSISTP